MRKTIFVLLLLILTLLFCYIWYGDSLKYSDEIKLAYDYIQPISQKTIKIQESFAQVMEYTPNADLEIINDESESLLNIIGKYDLKKNTRLLKYDKIGKTPLDFKDFPILSNF